MFGKNEIYKPFRMDDGSLVVNSIFPTLQGEGPDAGKTAIFIRLTHCNLRCWFCDTEFSEGARMSVHDIVYEIEKLRNGIETDLVVITGGEPFLQNFLPLVALCNRMDLAVSIETAGTLMLPHVESWFSPKRKINDNLIICSPKTPQINRELEPYIGAFKYIIRAECVDDDTGLPNVSTQREQDRAKLYTPSPGDTRPIYLQPMDEQNEFKNKENLDQAVRSVLRHNYILSVQLHKLAGLE